MPLDKHFRNLTNQIGVLPIKLGNALLENSDYTLIHVIDVKPIARNQKELSFHLTEFKKTLQENHPSVFSELERSFLNLENIELSNLEKLQFLNPTRVKKSLNFLGTGIKFISGNLDANDGDKYDTAIDSIRKGQIILENQVRTQYSLATQSVEQFKENIAKIQKNEDLIKIQLETFNAFIWNQTSSTAIKIQAEETLSEFALDFLTISGMISELENSVAFCYANVLHPSIIKSDDLISELRKVQTKTNVTFAVPINRENILNLEKSVKVHCQRQGSLLYYILSIPLNEKIAYEYVRLVPVPVFVRSEYMISRPVRQFIIRKRATMFSSITPCIFLKDQLYQCELGNFSPANQCEEEIFDGKSDACPHTMIDSPTTYVNLIPETQSFLGFLPQQRTIEIICPTFQEQIKISGSYLIQPFDCNITIENQTLQVSTSKKMYAPIFIPNVVNTETFKIPQKNIDLEKLEFKIDSTKFLPPYLDTLYSDIPTHYLWTSVGSLFTVSIILIVYCLFRKFSKGFKNMKINEVVPKILYAPRNLESCLIQASVPVVNEPKPNATPTLDEKWYYPGSFPVRTDFSK